MKSHEPTYFDIKGVDMPLDGPWYARNGNIE